MAKRKQRRLLNLGGRWRRCLNNWLCLLWWRLHLLTSELLPLYHLLLYRLLANRLCALMHLLIPDKRSFRHDLLLRIHALWLVRTLQREVSYWDQSLPRLLLRLLPLLSLYFRLLVVFPFPYWLILRSDWLRLLLVQVHGLNQHRPKLVRHCCRDS